MRRRVRRRILCAFLLASVLSILFCVRVLLDELLSTPELIITPVLPPASYSPRNVSSSTDHTAEATSLPTPLACQGDKESVYRLLVTARVANVSSLCPQLPTTSQIKQLYGTTTTTDSPVAILGLERCEAYRRGLVGTPNLRVAGSYNTGTNALARLLHANFYPHETYNETMDHFNVPWGKHTDLSVLLKNKNTIQKTELIDPSLLPIIVIKEPYYWMQSMCQTPYDAKWRRLYQRCPNLVPNLKERRAFPFLKDSFPVTVRYKGIRSEYHSLVHWWSSYYSSYLDWEVPRLLVRYEDVLFRGAAVFEAIAKCAGLPLKEFQFFVDPAKNHGNNAHIGLAQAVIKYGGGQNRTKRITADGLAFAREHLNATLMDLFQYRIV